MKWNWGTGIAIGMISFIAFILYMVITMSTDKNYSYDLVTEEYYAKTMVYQNEIDAENNLNSLEERITGTKTKDGWLLSFPSEIKNETITGKVFLYRPSNQQLDFDLPLVLSGSNLLIPDKNLIGGRWNITIDFKHNGKDFLYKNSIVY
ncbi:MAG: FixH family protein [Nonlabens sp.]|jgi:nitrogen fixation protein FixH|uniref:FixH family protein n=1 Tax=Nonlabens sp. TaxID=1888209 RepID=UPI00321AE1FF